MTWSYASSSISHRAGGGGGSAVRASSVIKLFLQAGETQVTLSWSWRPLWTLISAIQPLNETSGFTTCGFDNRGSDCRTDRFSHVQLKQLSITVKNTAWIITTVYIDSFPPITRVHLWGNPPRQHYTELPSSSWQGHHSRWICVVDLAQTSIDPGLRTAPGVCTLVPHKAGFAASNCGSLNCWILTFKYQVSYFHYRKSDS